MNIFITGSTGYIGGNVAQRLMNEGHVIRGLVRDPAKVEALEERGITPVLGDLDDSALLTDEARRSDAVINAASTIHHSSAKALLEGLLGSGKPFLHSGGIGMLLDDACGDRVSEQVFDEDSPYTVGELPPQKVLHELDMLVLEAAHSGVRSVVLSNPLIYGIGRGLKADSVQLPLLVNQARKSGISRVIGRGINRWSNVHIDDLTTLYSLALESSPAGAFYFVENGEASFAEIGDAIAYRLGLGPVESWSLKEAIDEWGEGSRYLLGSNSRVRGTRARRELGWAPEHNSITEWIRHEMPSSERESQ